MLNQWLQVAFTFKVKKKNKLNILRTIPYDIKYFSMFNQMITSDFIIILLILMHKDYEDAWRNPKVQNNCIFFFNEGQFFKIYKVQIFI